MKVIGIIGNTSWPSTLEYQRIINVAIERRAGGFHSAEYLLYGIDYHEIKSRYTLADGWTEIPKLLKEKVERLMIGKPDCLIIANNTLHKAFDIIEPQLGLQIPVLHAVRLTRDELLKHRDERVLFLATKFTMEDDFYTSVLKQAGLDIVVPNSQHRELIQVAQGRLAKGQPPDTSMKGFFRQMIQSYQGEGCRSVVLACTELPLAIDQEITPLRIVNPMLLQCQAAVNFAVT